MLRAFTLVFDYELRDPVTVDVAGELGWRLLERLGDRRQAVQARERLRAMLAVGEDDTCPAKSLGVCLVSREVTVQ